MRKTCFVLEYQQSIAVENYIRAEKSFTTRWQTVTVSGLSQLEKAVLMCTFCSQGSDGSFQGQFQ